MQEKTVESYITKEGNCPFEEWESEQEHRGQAIIRIRINRVAQGNLGKVNSVGDGVHELKFKSKGLPTYRIYFGNDGDQLIILLCGGDKSDQSGDIENAKEYWNDYKSRKEINE